MISYYLNWMGPINNDWIKQNGSHWSAGRIDVSGTMDNPCNLEYAVPPMNSSDWRNFAQYLNELETYTVWDKEKLYAAFELHTGRKIRWLRQE